MKRDYCEISDDEWPEDNSFNPSRVLKLNKPSSPPPPIESFAYSKSNNHDTSKPSNFVELVDSSSEEIGVRNVTENLEDDDAEIVSTVNQTTTSRGRRRFVVDDEDEDEDEGLNSNEDEQDIEVFEEIDAFEESEEDDDVVGKALQKCGKISTELKRELFGTAAAKFDSYAQVEEASSLRIVTQVVCY